MLASDNTFPIEYSVANFVGLVQNALESAEHMTPNSAQNANPYMRCSYDMLAHDVYSSSTSVAVSGSLGSMPALRERTHRTVIHQSSVISHQSSRIHAIASSSRRLRVVSSRASSSRAHQADFIDALLHRVRHRARCTHARVHVCGHPSHRVASHTHHDAHRAAHTCVETRRGLQVKLCVTTSRESSVGRSCVFVIVVVVVSPSW